MIYLSQLVRFTPRKIIDTARRVRITKVKAFIDKDEKGEFKYITANAKGNTNLRQVQIKLYGKMRGDGVMKIQNKCWVTCSCPYWRYHCEVAAAARGSSNVLISNGQFPKIRNPRMKPYLCKHLLALSAVAGKVKAKRRKVDKIESQELDQLVKLLEPFIPKSA